MPNPPSAEQDTDPGTEEPFFPEIFEQWKKICLSPSSGTTEWHAHPCSLPKCMSCHDANHQQNFPSIDALQALEADIFKLLKPLLTATNEYSPCIRGMLSIQAGAFSGCLALRCGWWALMRGEICLDVPGQSKFAILATQSCWQLYYASSPYAEQTGSWIVMSCA